MGKYNKKNIYIRVYIIMLYSRRIYTPESFCSVMCTHIIRKHVLIASCDF